MTKLLRAVALSGVLGFFAATASADPENGERLARRWCASCHLVAPDQKGASADVLPFATIARMPGFTVEKLAFFLLEPHPKMPNMALTRREATDIAEYIVKLGRAP
jgi:mono/diheme cytochrome c family protein